MNKLLCWLGFHRFVYADQDGIATGLGGYGIAGRHECSRCGKIIPRIEWPDPPTLGGYQPEIGLDQENPPQGGSGVPA